MPRRMPKPKPGASFPETQTNPMLFLRSLVFALLVALITMVWAILCFGFAPLPYAKRYYLTSRWNLMVIWAARVICGIRYEVRGMENLPDSPAVVLSKHQSAWETIFYLLIMPRPLVFVFKKSLTYIPFFGWGIALLRMIPIDRSKGRDAMAQIVESGRKRLADGQWVIMFPEGTRIPVGQAGKYKVGGPRLAVETNTVVVPVAVNSGECWQKNSFIKKPGLITVSIGKPISPEGLTAQALLTKVESWIESEMRVISPAVYANANLQAAANI
jgi:1-acyl-sn-glycerol-3-phosphate acyltransferase